MILNTLSDEEVSTRDMFHAPMVLRIVRDIDGGGRRARKRARIVWMQREGGDGRSHHVVCLLCTTTSRRDSVCELLVSCVSVCAIQYRVDGTDGSARLCGDATLQIV